MQHPDDKLTNNQNNDPSDDPASSNDSGQPSGSPIPETPAVDETLPDEPQFEEPLASPAVTGEEDPSGDAPGGEPVDIDDQLQKVGLAEDNHEE